MPLPINVSALYGVVSNGEHSLQLYKFTNGEVRNSVLAVSKVNQTCVCVRSFDSKEATLSDTVCGVTWVMDIQEASHFKSVFIHIPKIKWPHGTVFASAAI